MKIPDGWKALDGVRHGIVALREDIAAGSDLEYVDGYLEGMLDTIDAHLATLAKALLADPTEQSVNAIDTNREEVTPRMLEAAYDALPIDMDDGADADDAYRAIYKAMRAHAPDVNATDNLDRTSVREVKP